MWRWLFGIGVLGCAVPPVLDDSHDPATDTTTDATDETDATDASDDTDRAETDDTNPVDPPQPPASWGGGFVDVSGPILAPPAWPVDVGSRAQMREADASWAQFVDLDGDGRDDVVVGPHTGVPRSEERWIGAYRWGATGLEPAHELVQRLRGVGEPARTALMDLDGDGFLDVLGVSDGELVRWGSKDGWAAWEAPNEALRQPGNGANVVDFDQDGWLDVIVGAGCTHPLLLLQRVGPRQWDIRLDLADSSVGAAGTETALPVWPTGGDLHFVMVSDSRACGNQIAPHPGFYEVSFHLDDGMPSFSALSAIPADVWWTRYPESAQNPLSLMAPMGAALGDLDGDEDLDLMVTVGSLGQALFHGLPDGTFTDEGYEESLEVGVSQLNTENFPWAVAIVDFDRDGRNDLLMPEGDDSSSFGISEGATYTAGLWWNDGQGGFVDVRNAVGLGTAGGWHGLSLGDPDADGDADLIVGGFGTLPRVYRNDIALGKGFSLRLTGTTSTPQAVGAWIEVETAGLPLQRARVGSRANVDGWTGLLEFFATGADDAAREVRITWPSGWTQVFENVEAGTLHEWTEPETLRLSEADRRLPADATSNVRLEIFPRSADGSIDAGATVSVDQMGVMTSVSAPVRDPDGHWEVEIRAPDTAGSTQYTVTVNGKALQVRPRMWWDAVSP